MGLLDNLKKQKEVEALKKAIRESPSTANFSNLIKKYCEIGEDSNALEVAQNAMNEFPDSDAIFELYYRLKKSQSQAEIEALKKAIEEHPTYVAFAQLAEIYKDLRDEESAMKYCRKGIEKFPNADSCYLIIGELRLRRFYKDPLIKDGSLAIQNLERACEINNKNYKALLLIGKLYLQLGAVTKAKQKLKNILLFAPGDENVKKLLDDINKIPKPAHEDIDILLQTVETQRAMYYSLEEGQVQKIASPPGHDALNKMLLKFKALSGIFCVLVCNEKKEWIGEYSQEGLDLTVCQQAASIIYSTVEESSRQMDVGRCQRCQIEGPYGVIYILVYGILTYIIFCSSEQKQLYPQIQKVVESIGLEMKQ
jgi:tetratricopeptide (TPR) repeat protein